jgi:lysyl-tRNA synthetase class 2
VLLAALISARSRFTAEADPRGRSFAARITAQLLAVGGGYGLLLLYLPGHLPAGTSLWLRLREVAASLVGLGGWLPIRDDRYADTFHATLFGFGLLALTAALFTLLRPSEPVAALSEDDEGRLRTLLDRHGAADSLGYFALRRDKSVVWSPTGKAAITYRVVLGVALASGDPIGDPEAWPGAIAAFRALTERFGWTPAVMGCSELGATVLRREWGLTALALGDEAVLHTDDFCLAGRAMRGVRQACVRVSRAGYTTRIRRVRDLDAAELAELRAAAETWRLDAVERGYSMALGRLGDPADPDCLVVTAHRDGELRGLLHFVPWGPAGVSLDLMRRDRTSDNGLNEFMIAALMTAAADFGLERVSLNFAVFRDALERGARIGAGPVLRLWRRLLLVASRWWQIESLYRFNVKFRPEWRPRFISYPAARDVPRVALAALEAEAFLVRPHLVKRLVGRA